MIKRKRYSGVILAVALCFSLLFTQLVSYAELQSSEDKVKTSITSDKTSYYTGEKIELNVNVDVSGGATDYKYPYVAIKIPKEHVSPGPSYGTVTGVLGWPTLNDSEACWTIIYSFDEFVGGVTYEIPISLNMENGTTPDGHITTVTVTAYDNQGNPISTEGKISLTAKTTKPSLQVRSYEVEAGVEDSVNTGTIDPLDAFTLGEEFVLYNYDTDLTSGAGSTLGKYRVFIEAPAGVAIENREGFTWSKGAGQNQYYSDYDIDMARAGVSVKYNISYGGLTIGTPYQFNAYVVKDDGSGSLPTETNTTMKAYPFTRTPAAIEPVELLRLNTTERSVLYKDENKETVFKWQSTPKFNTSKEVKLRELREFNHDMLDIKTISFQVDEGITVGNCSLQGLKFGLDWETIQENPTAGKTYDVGGYDGYRIVFDDPLTISKSKGNVKFLTETKIKPEKWDDRTVIGIHDTYSQIVRFTDGMSTKTVNGAANFEVYEYNPTIWLTEYVPEISFYQGQRGLYGINIIHTGTTWKDSEVISNPKFVTFIPEGTKFVSLLNVSNNKTITPKVYENYKNTGRSAIVAEDFGDLTYEDRGFTIYYALQFDETVPKGENLIETYMTMDNPLGEPINFNSVNIVDDIYDLNENDEKTDKVAKTTKTINFTPPKALIGVMRVSTDKINYTRSLDGMEVGQDVSYEMEINNNTNNEVTSLTIINELPRKGDSRGSKFDVYLKNQVTVPSGYKATYFVGTVPNTIEEASQLTFLEGDDVSDFSQVSLIRVDMEQGNTLPISGKLSCTYDATTEKAEGLVDKDTSYNNYKYSANGAEWIEVVSAKAPVSLFGVEGRIFIDKNKNGIMDLDESFTWEQYDLKLVNVANGKEYSIQSNYSGSYKIGTTDGGNYKVKLVKKDGIKVSEIGASGQYFNTFDPNTYETEEFNLSVKNNTAKKDIGIYPTKGQLMIVSLDEEYKSLSSVNFSIVNKSTGQGTKAETDARGGLETTITIDEPYQIKVESVPEGYQLENIDDEVTVTIDSPQVTKSYIMKKIKGNIVITVHDELDSEVKIPGAKVRLEKISNTVGVATITSVQATVNQVNGQINQGTNPAVQEGITDENGQVSFANMDYGIYRVTQLETGQGYMVNSNIFEGRLLVQGETVQFNIGNGKVQQPATPGTTPPELPPTVMDVTKPPGQVTGTVAKVPKTGDDSFVVMCVTIIGLMGLMAAAVVGTRRTNK